LPDGVGISVFAPLAAGVIFRVVPLFCKCGRGISEIGPRVPADEIVVGLTGAAKLTAMASLAGGVVFSVVPLLADA
jgi:hypothetical protein